MVCASKSSGGDISCDSSHQDKKCCFEDENRIPLRGKQSCDAMPDECKWRQKKKSCEENFLNVSDDQIESRPIRATFEVGYKGAGRRRVMVTGNLDQNPTAVAPLYVLPAASETVLTSSVALPAST